MLRVEERVTTRGGGRGRSVISALRNVSFVEERNSRCVNIRRRRCICWVRVEACWGTRMSALGQAEGWPNIWVSENVIARCNRTHTNAYSVATTPRWAKTTHQYAVLCVCVCGGVLFKAINTYIFLGASYITSYFTSMYSWGSSWGTSLDHPRARKVTPIKGIDKYMYIGIYIAE